MNTLWEDLKKILKQLRGKENIFGYQSTEANQLYLLYCSTGNIYFSDKIHRQVKYLWLVPIIIEISTCYFAVMTNLWYASEIDFMMMFDILNTSGVCNGASFLLPLISYLFREDIEAMIEGVDEVITSRIKSGRSNETPKNIKSVKKLILFNVGIFCACFTVVFLYLFDVMIFFEEWKIDNRYYYPTSVPLVKQFRSQRNYFIFNFFKSIVVVQLFSRYVWILFFMMHWSVTSHNELFHVANEINTLSKHLNEYIGHRGNPSRDWDRYFITVLTRCVKRVQKILKVIDNFRGFIQIISAVTIPTSFFVIVAQLQVTITANLPFILQLKSIAYCASIVWGISVIYWTAQILETSVFNLSLAVYSTPWYKSIEPRKNIHIFLCQAQKMKPLTIIKVHSLLLQNFSRYLNGILSATNAIRKLTHK